MGPSEAMNVSSPQMLHGRISLDLSKALLTSTPKPKKNQDSLTHQICRCMHGVLNINENKN